MIARALALFVLCALSACSRSVVILEREDGAPEDAGSANPDGSLPEESAKLVAAFQQTCAADEDGLACWGANTHAELGLGSVSSVERKPRRLPERADYLSLCAGEGHTCALRADGQLACWGGNEHGQLGVGDREARLEPALLRVALRFSAVACGGEATCAIERDQTLYCWGSNQEGMPGQGDDYGSPDLLAPAKVALDRAFQQVSVGQGHVCAVTTGGTLYCWGRNTEAQLGLGSAPIQLRTPTLVDAGGPVSAVAAGQQHTCAVRRDGSLLCWGLDQDGRLGLGRSSSDRVTTPAQVGSLRDYTEVHVNWFHSCARRDGGFLMCWGRNIEGQLGVGDNDVRTTPTRVRGPADGWSGFSVGQFHTCALQDGHVYCWGKNEEGQLGLLAPERSNEPLRAPIAESASP